MSRMPSIVSPRRQFLLRQLGLLTLSAVGVLAARPAHAAPLRILHVASYRMDWIWNKQQFDSFKEALGVPDAVYKVVELDAKHKDASRRAAAIQEALTLIEQWRLTWSTPTMTTRNPRWR